MKSKQTNVELTQNDLQSNSYKVTRRDVQYASVSALDTLKDVNQDFSTLWEASKPIFLPGLLKKDLPSVAKDVAQTEVIVSAILESEDASAVFDSDYYQKQIKGAFELLAPVIDESSDQEMVKFHFDALKDGQVDAENIWCKLAWLSLNESDASLRFRFSFGLEDYEDVAADVKRQQLTADLAELLFAESKLVTKSEPLKDLLLTTLHEKNISYVERIIYFNAPNGGAQFHHDVERGHLGVVYAQVTGITFWFALPKQELIKEMQVYFGGLDQEQKKSIFKDSDELKSFETTLANTEALNELLDDRNNYQTEKCIDHNSDFFKYLVKKGHAYLLEPGDVLLLPQKDLKDCAWHTVFTLGEEIGEGLSFAIRS
jgi:hypothetical protein